MPDSKLAGKLAKLGALRAAYATDLPQRLQAIAASWQAAQADNNPAAPAELIRLVHSLAGSAGTFGYRRLGEKARELEESLVRVAREPLPAAAARTAHNLALLDALRQIALAGTDDNQGVTSDRLWPADAERSDPDNHRIVLIEDDPLLAQELAAQLGMFGWEVTICVNAIDASVVLREARPAAVVIDVALPEGSLAGLELIEQVQAREGGVLPHVVISARAGWEPRLAAVRSGAAAYLVKPVDIAALDEQLRRICQPSSAPPYRVLVVDDDQVLANHYAQTLAVAGMDAIAITSPARLLDAMAEHRPEIVVMDLYMPECSGVEALLVLRQDTQFASLPVLFLSTESGVAEQQKAIMTGAEDFLTKPISDANLIMAVTVRAERFRGLTSLIRQDSLTGLLNHISFKLRLESEVDRSRREQQVISVAMIDIDHFKKVNDTYGHPVGDRVIKGLAQLMSKRLRKSDIIGRYGGEEFAVVMPNTLPALAIEIMNELRESFGKLRFETIQGEFSCTFSCGVSTAPPFESGPSLINAADEALYRAKHSGRNQVAVFAQSAE